MSILEPRRQRRAARQRQRGQWRQFFGIYRRIRIPWVLYAMSVGAGVIAAQASIALARPYAAIAQGNFALTTAVPLFVGLSLGQICITLIRLLTAVFANERVTKRVQSLVWWRVVRAPVRSMNDHSASELISRVTNDPLQAQAAPSGLSLALPSVWGLVGAVVAMAQANASLTAIYVWMVPVAFVVFWAVGRLQFAAQRRIVTAWAVMVSFFSERLGQLAAQRASAPADGEIKAGDRAINEMFKAGIFQVLIESVQVLLGSTIQHASTLIVFVGGATLVRGQDMTQEELVLFYALAGAAMPFLFELLTHYQMIKGAHGFTSKIAPMVAIESEDVEAGTPLPSGVADIELRGVSFAFDSVTVLRDVSIRMPAGKITAIVGPNGSGKSTLLSLLQRMQEPDTGELLCNGDPASIYRLSDWRWMVNIVPQNSPIVSGSLRENIAFADLNAPDDRVFDAARVAHIEDLAQSMPGGYNGEVGETGGRLSGGQRQRVAIARSVFAEPEVLLLDEAGSALDPRTDARVDEALRKHMAGRTMVLVTHKPSTIANADNIVVLKDGAVETTGLHADLLERSSTYRALVQAETLPTVTQPLSQIRDEDDG